MNKITLIPLRYSYNVNNIATRPWKQDKNTLLCKNCKFFQLSEFNKEYDSIYDNAVCKKFDSVYNHYTQPIEIDYVLAKTCRYIEAMCGPDARWYQKK